MQFDNSISFIVQGNPIPKQRSRKGAYGNWYNPQSTEMNIFKRIIKNQLPEKWEIIPAKKPIQCDISFFFEINKTNISEGDPYVLKKDRDNLDKFVLDSLSKIVYYDDCQVYCGWIEKVYSKIPRTEIKIQW